jgi:hypothetical protein
MVSVVALSEAWALDRLYAEIMGSSPDGRLSFCVVLSCVGSGLATG